MGSHYHFIVFMEAFRELSRSQLVEKAKQLYGKRFGINTAGWQDADWEAFNYRLFDLSCLMQQINGRFGAWFNQVFSRRGPLWSARFKNPQLLDLSAVQECLFYIELNAVRAGLVERPEQWEFGSARLRFEKKDQDLMPLEEIFPGVDPEEVYSIYRCRLYLSGSVSTKGAQAKISPEIVEKEARTGFRRTGRYGSRLRFFTDGLAVGCKEKVEELLTRFRLRNDYKRRKNPISHLEDFIFTLREQRSTGV